MTKEGEREKKKEKNGVVLTKRKESENKGK